MTARPTLTGNSRPAPISFSKVKLSPNQMVEDAGRDWAGSAKFMAVPLVPDRGQAHRGLLQGGRGPVAQAGSAGPELGLDFFSGEEQCLQLGVGGTPTPAP